MTSKILQNDLGLEKYKAPMCLQCTAYVVRITNGSVAASVCRRRPLALILPGVHPRKAKGQALYPPWWPSSAWSNRDTCRDTPHIASPYPDVFGFSYLLDCCDCIRMFSFTCISVIIECSNHYPDVTFRAAAVHQHASIDFVRMPCRTCRCIIMLRYCCVDLNTKIRVPCIRIVLKKGHAAVSRGRSPCSLPCQTRAVHISKFKQTLPGGWCMSKSSQGRHTFLATLDNTQYGTGLSGASDPGFKQQT